MIRLSKGLREALSNTTLSLSEIFKSGVIEIYSGDKPPLASMRPNPKSLLCVIDPRTSSGEVTSSGIAGFFRYTSPIDNAWYIDGDISHRGADFNMCDTCLTIGTTVTVDANPFGIPKDDWGQGGSVPADRVKEFEFAKKKGHKLEEPEGLW